MIKAQDGRGLIIVLGFTMMILGCGEKPVSQNTPVMDETNKKTILFLGDSLTAGYGLDPSEAYPALIQEKILAAQLPYTVSNAGISGSTSHDGLNRIDWYLESRPAIMVLALGANDGLRGINPDVTKDNLKKIISRARESNSDIQILLAGMKAPPNMGLEFMRSFNAIFTTIHKELNVEFVPFLLKNVAAVPKLNLADGIHPNVDGQKIMAETVWDELKDLL